MSNKFKEIKAALFALSQEIYEYAYDYYHLSNDWDNDEVIITIGPIAIAEGVDFDGERPIIVTSAVKEVAWLIGRLRDAFDGALSGPQQTEFYARIAQAIRTHQSTQDGERSLNDMLMSATNEAFLVLTEMEEAHTYPWAVAKLAPSVFIMPDAARRHLSAFRREDKSDNADHKGTRKELNEESIFSAHRRAARKQIANQVCPDGYSLWFPCQTCSERIEIIVDDGNERCQFVADGSLQIVCSSCGHKGLYQPNDVKRYRVAPSSDHHLRYANTTRTAA